MDKRGEISFEELLKAIVSMTLVVFLIIAGVKIWNATHPEKFSIEKKDLKRIASEVKDLKAGESIDVPYFSTSSYDVRLIKVTSDSKSVYNMCNKDYCVCFNKGNNVISCESFDIDINKYNNDKESCKNIDVNSNGVEGLKQISIKSESCNVNLAYPVVKQIISNSNEEVNPTIDTPAWGP